MKCADHGGPCVDGDLREDSGMDWAFDQISYWSEVKLDIISEYAQTYSTILAAQQKPRLEHIYIDGFAGAGVHMSRESGDLITGSPANALAVQPPFKEYHFIDMNGLKVDSLRRLCSDRQTAHVYLGDCNKVLLEQVFPRCRWDHFKRALCLLDPYGLNLDWEVLRTAGQMKSVEVFLNFPVMDMNRNVLWRNPDKVDPRQVARMDAFWGDGSWRDAAYRKEETLFGFADQKNTNDDIVRAFQQRLKTVAGFKHVPDPVPMKNSKGFDVYYLFFASAKPVAGEIVRWVFDKYRGRGSGSSHGAVVD
jgi:three-Cys-motif partner protein